MIHSIEADRADRHQLRRIAEPPAKHDVEEFDYSNVIVRKPWGYEYLAFSNRHVAIWMLQIVRNRRTSMHSHPKKKTSLILLSGRAECSHLAGKIELGPLDGVVIDRGAFHSTEASSTVPLEPISENGIWVMEIESPPAKTDLVRLKDSYGRAGAAYEGQKNMVFDPERCIRFRVPDANEDPEWELNDCKFSIRRGDGLVHKSRPSPDSLISIIASDASVVSENPQLAIGGLTSFEEFSRGTVGEELGPYTFLVIQREVELQKVSDFVFSKIADLGVKHVFSVSGGAAMHLTDSVGKHPELSYVATHHEQAAAMAAEGYARTSKSPGCALVTSGPGGTNAMTGVAGAWIDSIPTIFISGQVTSDCLIGDTGVRQLGIQESNIVEMVRSITKYAVSITDPGTLRYHVEKAIHLATTGRPGPVWLDIPLDVQGALVNVDEQKGFDPADESHVSASGSLTEQVYDVVELLRAAERPVLIYGYGVRLAGAESALQVLADRLGIPLISSWNASDLIDNRHPLYIGRSGIMGERAGNFTVQNSDLLLTVGTRLSVPQVGYNHTTFARAAKKIVVDIDPVELSKPTIQPDLPIQADAGEFIDALSQELDRSEFKPAIESWVKRCQGWKARYPVIEPEYRDTEERINSFYFIDVLSEKLRSDSVVVTDMGTSFTCTMQSLRMKAGQRLFTSSGHASMGFGLPGAIGACLGRGGRKTICISGDGGLQMNIQELQTLVHNQLPIILFVLNNDGYLAIKLTQQNHFGRLVGSEPSSGVSCPDLMKVSTAYGIDCERISDADTLDARIDAILAKPGPYICEIMMPPDQKLVPRLSSVKKPDGSIMSNPLEDLAPALDRDEFLANMIVPPVDVLK